jgi:hypothetical protein
MQRVYDGDEHTEGRRALVARLLSERPWCEACELLERPGVKVSMASQDVHEILPRSAGGSLTDPANLLCLCRGCHMYLHAHPAKALALGLKRSRYEVPQP